eukprot:SAG22_NODE_2071_length_3051_cov_4.999661_1_plen_44_part_10
MFPMHAAAYCVPYDLLGHVLLFLNTCRVAWVLQAEKLTKNKNTD